MTNNTDNILLIIICAAITYIMRITGLLIADKIPANKSFNKFIKILPSCLLIAYTIPGIIESGPNGYLAAVAVIILTFKFNNILISVGSGACIMFGLNYLNI